MRVKVSQPNVKRPSETFQTAAKAKHRTWKCSVFFNGAASLTPGTDLSE
ncbi:hypothetical protein NEIELOOT_01494 [Neisseria elongata subsp. glycolytica ATCC 29315]|uniref:Uncharacterized protein n=1 Tax=Neisseria elongata subsp. glycolytica ATCC 29315 TaxID=546263 RepID=D4DR01_NEIEG|nr:hypothetical protein NEIELOOT_01494 [Neisseria elongata subsp. glycolytica ATCC 29315]